MNPKALISPLESRPEILKRIGLFIVLFNTIDYRIGIEFYFIINQQDKERRPIFDFLSSQDFKKKLDMLKSILGDNLYSKIEEINKFRTFVSHALYGVDSLGEVSMTKLNRRSKKYDTNALSENKLDEYIQKEREALALFHELLLKRMPRITKKNPKLKSLALKNRM